MIIFRRKRGKEDVYVDTSIGRVYFKPLSNGIINKANILSDKGKGVINNAHFISTIELQLINLSPKKWFSLSPKDGLIIRLKVREILIEHNLLEEV